MTRASADRRRARLGCRRGERPAGAPPGRLRRLERVIRDTLRRGGHHGRGTTDSLYENEHTREGQAFLRRLQEWRRAGLSDHEIADVILGTR
jgi:hypothetical protein